MEKDNRDFVTRTKDYIQIESSPYYYGGPVENFDLVPIHTTYTIFVKHAKGNNHNFLGIRPYDKESKQYLEYVFTTYNDTYEDVEIIGSAFEEIGLKPNEFVCGCYVNRKEWIITDLATWRQAAGSLPLRSGLNFAYYESIVNKVRPSLAVVDAEKIEEFMQMCETLKQKESSSIRVIIALPFLQGPRYGDDYLPEDIVKRGEKIGIKVMSYDELYDLGKKHPHPPAKQSPDNYHTLIFTSGTTTDKLKGVLHVQKCVMLGYCRAVEIFEKDGGYYSYVNHQHISEIECIGAIIVSNYNVVVCFASNGFTNFMRDLELAHPTIIPSPPIILKLFYQIYTQLLAKGLSEEEVKLKLRKKIGGRMVNLCTYGAPSARELVAWAIKTFDVKVPNFYGLTETGGVCTHVPGSKELFPLNNIGAPHYQLSIRLVSCPELGCLITDNPPKGEILVKSLGINGYFKDPELTKEAIDEDGWLHTKDLGQLEDNGTITMVGRKDFMVKVLSAGYVSLESIEEYLETSPIISIPLVYGDHLDNFLICILNPDFRTLASDKRLSAELKEKCLEIVKKPDSEEAQDFCRNKDILKIYLEEIKNFSKKFNFPAHWNIEGVIIESVLWTEQNGMLTSSKKIRRKAIVEKYKNEIFALKEELRKTVKLNFV